jgi:hypothetical protein
VPFRRAEISAQPSLKAWRHWLRFRVRGLLVLLLVIGGGLGWIVHQAHVQRDAVAAIEEVKASQRRMAVYHREMSEAAGGPLRVRGSPSSPTRSRRNEFLRAQAVDYRWRGRSGAGQCRDVARVNENPPVTDSRRANQRRVL